MNKKNIDLKEEIALVISKLEERNYSLLANIIRSYAVKNSSPEYLKYILNEAYIFLESGDEFRRINPTE